MGWWTRAPGDGAFWDRLARAGPDAAAAVRAAVEASDAEAPGPIGVRELHADLLGPVDRLLARLMAEDPASPEGAELLGFRERLHAAAAEAARVLDLYERVGAHATGFIEIENDFLFDSARDLFAIGYNVSELRRDASFYDLLASEARLASFVGIADGELPQAHWFALGRQLTTSPAGPVLLSWSGSMFEYLCRSW
jgi:hypothetical protein